MVRGEQVQKRCHGKTGNQRDAREVLLSQSGKMLSQQKSINSSEGPYSPFTMLYFLEDHHLNINTLGTKPPACELLCEKTHPNHTINPN
jgi:hypothetical protein